MPDMPSLPPEIWANIIGHLYSHPGRPDGLGSSRILKQDALVKCMRVSKVFHTLASEHLYTRVITDDLTSFLSALNDDRPVRGIQTKRDLILRVQSLHLEYPHETAAREDLQGTRIWSRPAYRDSLAHIASAEASSMSSALASLTALYVANPQHRLESISCGSYLGSRDLYWEICNIQGGKTAIEHCRDTLMGLLRTLRPLGYCQRGTQGPLTVPLDCSGLLDYGFDLCVHIDKRVYRAPIATCTRPADKGGSIDMSPLNKKGTTRWYIEHNHLTQPVLNEWNVRNGTGLGEEAESGLENIKYMAMGMLANYYSFHRQAGMAPGGMRDQVKLIGYVDEGRESASQERETDEIEAEMGKFSKSLSLISMSERLPPRGYRWEDLEHDEVEWQSMAEAPPCQACGWV